MTDLPLDRFVNWAYRSQFRTWRIVIILRFRAVFKRAEPVASCVPTTASTEFLRVQVMSFSPILSESSGTWMGRLTLQASFPQVYKMM